MILHDHHRTRPASTSQLRHCRPGRRGAARSAALKATSTAPSQRLARRLGLVADDVQDGINSQAVDRRWPTAPRNSAVTTHSHTHPGLADMIDSIR